MGNFDITKTHSSFFASLNKRKRLGLDSDSDSEEEDVKRTTKAKPSQEKTPESNGNSQPMDSAAQQTPPSSSSENTTSNNAKPIIPQHTDVHLASLSQQVQQQLMELQGLGAEQQSNKNKAINIDDEEWLKEVTGEPSGPPPASKSADLINLSSDEEEMEPLDQSLMQGLDPELLKLVQNRSRAEQAQQNKIDLKIQYVNENNVNEIYRALLEKLMKPIKIRVMDGEQFEKVLQVFCSKKKLKKDDTVLVYKEDKVFLRTTPSGLGMKPGVDYVLHVYPRHAYEAKIQKEKEEREERFQKRREEENMMERLLSDEAEASSSAAASAAPEEQEQKLNLILRGKDGKDVHLRAKPTTLLKTLVEHYARISELPNANNIKLQLDGETLNLNDNVEAAGLEDEDLVDVII